MMLDNANSTIDNQTAKLKEWQIPVGVMKSIRRHKGLH